MRRERCFSRNVKKNSFKSYARLKFWILVAILIDFGQKLRFFYISLKLYLVSQFWSKLAEIWTRSSLDDEENQRGFFENFNFLRFPTIFNTQNCKISHFLVKNQHKTRKNQNFQKSLFDSLHNYFKMIWSKFHPIWTKIWTLNMIFLPKIYKNCYQNRKVQLHITSKRNFFWHSIKSIFSYVERSFILA